VSWPRRTGGSTWTHWAWRRGASSPWSLPATASWGCGPYFTCGEKARTQTHFHKQYISNITMSHVGGGAKCVRCDLYCVWIVMYVACGVWWMVCDVY